MLAEIAKPSAEFRSLARYLVRGTANKPDPNRVAWILVRNLPTDDPNLAALYMGATAAANQRCRLPCYHAMIAWHPDERPDPALMQAIAQSALDMIGLGEHQALVMGHGDTAHPHCHIMVNRIHPLTAKAWSNAHDWRRFDKIMRQLAEVHGFRHTAAHAFNPESTQHLPRQPRNKAWRAARYGARTDRMQMSQAEINLLATEIDALLPAQVGFDDLSHVLQTFGLTLEAKGKGHVIGNHYAYAKLSALGLSLTSRNGLARIPRKRPLHIAKQGVSRSVRPARPLVDTVDIARALVTLGLAPSTTIRNAVKEAQGKRLARRAHAPLIAQLLEELKRHWSANTAHHPAGTRRRASGKAQLARAGMHKRAKARHHPHRSSQGRGR